NSTRNSTTRTTTSTTRKTSTTRTISTTMRTTTTTRTRKTSRGRESSRGGGAFGRVRGAPGSRNIAASRGPAPCAVAPGSLLQFGLEGLDQLGVVGLDVRLEPGDHRAVLADQELGEVPLHVAAELRVGVLRGQVLVQRADAGALDHDLREHVELDA